MMRVIALIEEPEFIKRILRHLEMWDPLPETISSADPAPPLPDGEPWPLTYHPVLELQESGTLFGEYSEWNYGESNNVEYQAVRKEIETLKKSLASTPDVMFTHSVHASSGNCEFLPIPRHQRKCRKE